MRYVFLLVAVVFVVMVSGCPDTGDIGGASFVMGNGLQVNSFDFKPAKLVSGQATLLKLEMQNMGSLNVEEVYVNFYGLSNEWDGELIGDFSGNFEDRVVDVSSGLRSANAEFKTEGQKEVIVWKLTSPEEYLAGTEFAHRAYVRVCYPYETNVVAKVEVVGEDEWLVMEQSGKFSEHPIDVKQTAAPIQVHIESMQPVVVGNSMSMELRVSNVGGGIAFVGEDDGGMSCEKMFSGSDVDVALDLNNVVVDISDASCEILGESGGDVWLSRGQERTVSVKCDGFSSDMPRQEFNLNIKFKYNYYIDAETSVVLVGVEGEYVGVDVSDDDDELPLVTSDVCGYSLDNPEIIAGGGTGGGVIDICSARVENLRFFGSPIVEYDIENDGSETVIINGERNVLSPTDSVTLVEQECVQSDGEEVVLRWTLSQEQDDSKDCDINMVLSVQRIR